MNSWVFYSILQDNLNKTEDMKWIDVNDQLPPWELKYWLVCLQNDVVTEAGYNGSNWFKHGIGDIPENNPVTHWMPMPNPPKRKKKATTI